MKTISLKAISNLNAFSFRFALALLGQWFGAFLAFILGLVVANIGSPLPQFIMEKMPETGIMSVSSAMLFNGGVNATSWSGRRGAPA